MFVELELIADEARRRGEPSMLSLRWPRNLHLGRTERRSYLEMMLEKLAQASIELSFSALAHFAILRDPYWWARA